MIQRIFGKVKHHWDDIVGLTILILFFFGLGWWFQWLFVVYDIVMG